MEYIQPLRDWTDAQVLEFLGDRLPPGYAHGLTGSLDCMTCTAYLSRNPARLRYLREVRELGFRDLGGLVFDQHRFQRPNEALVESKVAALRAGGDDYVTKPFSLAEIVERTEAILRRTGGALPGDVLQFSDLVLDETRHEVFRGETPIPLTATEFSLLRYFLLNPRRVLSKTQILQNVWRYDFGGNTNVVETYVSYLRRKLDATGPPLIKTIRQAGYMLEAS